MAYFSLGAFSIYWYVMLGSYKLVHGHRIFLSWSCLTRALNWTCLRANSWSDSRSLLRLRKCLDISERVHTWSRVAFFLVFNIAFRVLSKLAKDLTVLLTRYGVHGLLTPLRLEASIWNFGWFIPIKANGSVYNYCRLIFLLLTIFNLALLATFKWGISAQLLFFVEWKATVVRSAQLLTRFFFRSFHNVIVFDFLLSLWRCKFNSGFHRLDLILRFSGLLSLLRFLRGGCLCMIFIKWKFFVRFVQSDWADITDSFGLLFKW